MELNGLYNAQVIIRNRDEFGHLSKDDWKALESQLDTLERYLIEYNQNPKIHWHDVYPNPQKYPTFKEKGEVKVKFLKELANLTKKKNKGEKK